MNELTKSIARAAGITEPVLERWTKINPVRKESEDDSNRFNLEGPILDSAMENYHADSMGFVTPARLRDFLADREGQDIEININSPGGNVFAANSMVSDLRRHEGKITVVVNGACFSAAADFLTIPGSTRIAMPGSMVMIHNAWTIAVGDSKELKKVITRLEKMNQMCIDNFAKSTEFDKDELARMMDEETWFTADEALTGGFVDKIWDEDKQTSDDEADDSRIDVSLDRAKSVVAHRIASNLNKENI